MTVTASAVEMNTKIETIGEAEVDNRRRISLAKAGVPENARFLIEKDPDGTIHLIPVTSIPTRELGLISNPEFVAGWTESVRKAEEEPLHDVSFADKIDD